MFLKASPMRRAPVAVCARLAIAVALVSATSAVHVLAAGLPSGFVESLVASGLISPTTMQFAPDGRLFVCQQGGELRVISSSGALLPTPFVTLPVSASGERGLLGVAFDPAFATNGFVYVYYTARTPTIHNRVSRFTANGDVAVAGSEVVILDLETSTAATHNAGALHFGPDGKLYIAVGDDGNGANAQSFTSRRGKLLRINKDGTIPSDNPFVSQTSGPYRAIWAMGLRNPFTFAFNANSGAMFINDVGEASWEEIDDGIAGANYGWPATEGYTTNPAYVSPRYAYAHGTTSSTGCAITSGVFYDPVATTFPSSYGTAYFFADYCGGWIRKLDTTTNTSSAFATGIIIPVDVKVSRDGDLYYLARGNTSNAGAVYRIAYGQSPPTITVHPASQTVPPGSNVTFSVTANGTAPLTYQWQRNGTSISGATSSTLLVASVTTADNGARFRVIVGNAFGSVTSNDAILTVTTNQAPTATITQPAAGTLYAGGMVITYAGTGTDPEDGTRPASAFTWEIVFHHDAHTHPFILPFSGVTSGSFTIPTTGETSSNVWYRIHLTVKDSAGVTNSVFRDIRPRVSQITLATSPTGLALTLDGQPVTAPFTFTGVVGIQRSIGAATTQTLGGVTYDYLSWSDNQPATHTIRTPATNTTYTATYRAHPSGGFGDGLFGQYFERGNFQVLAASRVDPTVNFVWAGAPLVDMGADTFSVRWTGRVMAPATETFTFYTQSDDGVRLWVNNQLLIDNWAAHPVMENSGTIALVSGQAYSIRLEYQDRSGQATIRLLWSSPSTPKAVIPQARLSSF